MKTVQVSDELTMEVNDDGVIQNVEYGDLVSTEKLKTIIKHLQPGSCVPFDNAANLSKRPWAIDVESNSYGRLLETTGGTYFLDGGDEIMYVNEDSTFILNGKKTPSKAQIKAIMAGKDLCDVAGYTVQALPGGITIGCQFIPNKGVLALAKAAGLTANGTKAKAKKKAAKKKKATGMIASK